MEGNNASFTDDANQCTFKRSSRVKKNKKFFGEDSSSANKNRQNKSKTKLNAKEKASNKKIILPGARLEKPSGVPCGVEDEGDLKAMDDEDLWLEALEKGELDDNGEIPKARDPSLMTTRQRALMDRSATTLVEEISPTSKEETEEERNKRLEKNRKRKLQAVKRAKETQKQTIRKLIEIPKTTKDKQKSSISGYSSNKPSIPMIKYVNNSASCTISYPEGYEFPLKRVKAESEHVAADRLCDVCGKKRRYSCSKTNASLCGLKCYKENLSMV